MNINIDKEFWNDVLFRVNTLGFTAYAAVAVIGGDAFTGIMSVIIGAMMWGYVGSYDQDENDAA